jgi:putative hemolysin
MKRILTIATIFALIIVTSQTVLALANPSAVFCEDQGYSYEIKTDGESNQYGICLFDDGKSCGGWDFYNDACGSEYRRDQPQASPSAQALEDQEESSPSAQVVGYQDVLNSLREDYRGQLQEYRTREKEFRIYKDQYLELQTLASIEKAVQSSKQALIARDKVLLTYLDILKFSLMEHVAIPADEKQFILTRIEALKAELQVYDQVVQSSSDRDQINSVIADFTDLGKSVKEISDHALLLMTVGKLQAVYDNSATFFTEIEATRSNDEQTIQQKAVERAVNETNKILDEEAKRLADLWQKIKDQKEKSAKYQNVAENSKLELNSSYSNLNKLLSYLEELVEFEN